MIDNKIEKDHGESVCLVIEKNEGEGTWRKVVWGNIYLLEIFFFKVNFKKVNYFMIFGSIIENKLKNIF